MGIIPEARPTGDETFHFSSPLCGCVWCVVSVSITQTFYELDLSVLGPPAIINADLFKIRK